MNRAVRIAIAGDFNPEYRSHHATNAALQHAAEALGARLDFEWVETPRLAWGAPQILRDYDGVVIAPGSPYRSMEGAFAAIWFARTQQWPLIGT